MDSLRKLYAIAVGVGFGGIAFAISYHCLAMIERFRLLLRRERLKGTGGGSAQMED
jgi:hypothetical protein